jgi:hypothetical protein
MHSQWSLSWCSSLWISLTSIPRGRRSRSLGHKSAGTPLPIGLNEHAMANREHLAKLKEGVKAWNRWRVKHAQIIPSLSGARLTKANLAHINLRKADLEGAIFAEADLSHANLADANLYKANFWRANLTSANLRRSCITCTQLSGTNLTRADLREAELNVAYCRGANFTCANLSFADLGGAIFFQANLRQANLSGADLGGAVFMKTDMQASNIEDCAVYGVSAWDVKLDHAAQRNLIITPPDQPTIQVDNLEVAQFIYLLINNQKVRGLIDAIRSKVVLILGRFTPERKIVLEAIRGKLRHLGYLPVLFDFEKPTSQTTEETVSTLAHMAHFVIADLTDAKSILQELRAIIPNNPSVIVQPLLLATEKEPGMFDFFRKYPWVLKPFRYTNQKALISKLNRALIAPAEAKARLLVGGS